MHNIPTGPGTSTGTTSDHISTMSAPQSEVDQFAASLRVTGGKIVVERQDQAQATSTATAVATVEEPTLPPNTVTLDQPIIRGNQTITHVTVRRPRAGELRGVQLVNLLQMDVAALQTVLPRITIPTLNEHDVRNMDPADLVQLGTEVTGFLLPKAATSQSA